MCLSNAALITHGAIAPAGRVALRLSSWTGAVSQPMDGRTSRLFVLRSVKSNAEALHCVVKSTSTSVTSRILEILISHPGDSVFAFNINAIGRSGPLRALAIHFRGRLLL